MNPLATIVLLPLVAGTLLCFALGRDNSPARRTLTALAAGGVTIAALALLLSLAPQVLAGQTLIAHTDWVPSLGLSIGWRLDGLALLFALLITGIGLLIVIYAHFYLAASDPAGKFYTLLMLFMAAMLGVVMSDNIMLLVVFWELTSVSSFLLVGYWGHKEEARAGARMALAVTGGGGLVMLAGFVLLGQVAGTYELSEILTRGDLIKADPLYPLLLVLILVGCVTKSAQVPFHFWLPEAMAAPTPVSAYLHSATMVKAGVFLLARLYPAIGGTDLFEGIVASFGLATVAFAAWVAIFKHDLKSLLAYSTVSHLGFITFLIGLGSPLSAVAAVFHVLNHATFKAALFMSAGIIDHETGTRDLRRLGGLYRLMPWTATFAMTAAAAMAGIPLFNGFLSKEMFFHEALESTMFWGAAVPVIATFAGVCSMAYSVRLVHATFFDGAPKDLPPDAHPHDPPFGMLAPVALLAVLCVVVGIFPAVTYGPLVHAAASALLGTAPPDYHLAIWHGFNLPLLMSAIAVVAGTALYFALQRSFRLPGYTPQRWSGRATFTCLIDGLFAFAGRLTARVENGSLQRSLAVMVALTLLLAFAPFWSADALPSAGTRSLMPASPLAIAVWALLLITATVLVLTHHNRFQALVLTGVVGLVTALTFVALSAPDLALTQLSVEVVSAVLMLMGLALLPQRTPFESGALRRSRDAVLSLAAGAGVAGLSWLMLTRDHDSISWFFLDKSLSEGGGTNVVNVILVDFRGYDTFGEITVLGIAGIGVLALLDGFRTRRPDLDPDGRRWTFEAQPLLLRVAASVLLPLALAVSAYIFWRGHNLPGGGFIAGLITAVALVMQYMALGQARAEALLRGAAGSRFTRWIGSGLSIAGLTGIGAFIVGRPFLTSAHGHPTLPVLGELPLASAAAFDLGVYITVVGATMLTLSVLGSASKEHHA
jgi:multicomponent K+:H+ antiporter subunit A